MKTTDYEHGPLPTSERKTWLSIAVVWIAIGIDLSGAFLGIALANGMEFWSAILATMVGSLVLGLLAMACAYVGAATGLSTAMISRVVFGKIGGAILALAITISLVGWFAVQAGFFGTNAQIAFVELTGADVPAPIFTAVGAVLMALTAFWGYRSISKLSVLAVPVLLLLLTVGVIAALIAKGTGSLDAPVEAAFTFGGAVSLVIGIFVLGAVLAPDMARWAKSPKQAMGAGFIGFFFGNSIILVVSIVLAKVMNETEIVTIFFALGLGLVAIIVLILAQWTTNTTNLYSAGLGLSSVSPRIDRRKATIALGIVGIVVAVLGAADFFIQFILITGIVIAPFGGVYLAAFVTDRRPTRWNADREVPMFNGWAIGAWVAGVFVALATVNPADGLGFGWFTLTTIPALDGLIAGAIIYLALAAVRRRVSKPETMAVGR